MTSAWRLTFKAGHKQRGDFRQQAVIAERLSCSKHVRHLTLAARPDLQNVEQRESGLHKGKKRIAVEFANQAGTLATPT